MTPIPDVLYYNCAAPNVILRDRRVLVRAGTWKIGGISMSEWSQMGSHGPFKIAFRRSPWFSQFKPCVYPEFRTSASYSDPLVRNAMFKDEREWWSSTEVRFKVTDVIFVMWMTNAPSILGPRATHRICKALREYHCYIESTVNDPYLKQGT